MLVPPVASSVVAETACGGTLLSLVALGSAYQTSDHAAEAKMAVQLRLSGGTVGELLALADRLQIEGVVAAVVPYVIGSSPRRSPSPPACAVPRAPA